MKILLTGIAGFIGFHVARKLLENNYEVIGIDNINDYYDVSLKENRLKELGIETITEFTTTSTKYPSLRFAKIDIRNTEKLKLIFETEKPDYVCHLAAQPGVRYSLQNPHAYIDNNVMGFLNILECCRQFSIKHLLFASSSSIYGLNSQIPFSTNQMTDQPASLYAATKKSNELMAYTYSHIYGLKTTGLRFFTVYGPWGRPDMAPMLFVKAILEGKPIKVFNFGNMQRDFTYVDDIAEGVVRMLRHKPTTDPPYQVLNIGNGKPVSLEDFIIEIENALYKKAVKELLPMQDGDVVATWADTSEIEQLTGLVERTDLHEGIEEFIRWYKEYY
ncbi:MAG: NAD-dependent epimerase [Bacteroidales bacterium]|jgi:UDP-glucuronate 4-epimerase|nr:NAD-dependent epimerase [Bacteroidales bacterium]